MKESVYYFIVAAVLLALIPIVPKMIAFRIRVLHFLRWKSLASWHERNFRGFVIGVRLIMVAIALTLIIVASTG
ncbi:MAG: hypothetical protein ACYS21_17960 [Planctomycetota bacterium]|jgi:hypothetical protein